MKTVLILLLSLLLYIPNSYAQVYYYPATPYYYTAPVYAPPVVVTQPIVVAPPIVQVAPVVTVPVAPICTTYPDPWDTLGYIFGDPIMIQVCR